MNDPYHPDILLDLAKIKMREYHQEGENVSLAREAGHFQLGRIRNAGNQRINPFKRLVLKLENRFGFRRAVHEKAVAPDQTSLRSTHLER